MSATTKTSPRMRRSAQRNSITESFKVAALAMGEQEQVRSISGRLGGHFDSSRSLDLHAILGGEAVVDEETRLVATPEGEEVVDIHTPPTAPPLLQWIWVALLCANAYAFYNIFIKKGSATINPILGGVILQFVAAVMGSVLLLGLMYTGDGMKLHADKDGIKWSICAGLAVGVAEMLSFFVSGMGVPVTHSIPVIIGGSVLIGAVMGIVLLGEKMMCHGWSGIAMLVTGIALVATDPGDKVVEGGGSSSDDESPPLMKWLWIALCCATAYALYNIFIKKGSASINPILGGVILQYVAALFGSILLGAILLAGDTKLECDKWGIIWSCCAGFSVGAAEMLSFVVSGMGVQATQSIPTIIGGSVMFGAILGLLILGETLMFQGWGGVFLLMIGIGFVATDPGEKVAGH